MKTEKAENHSSKYFGNGLIRVTFFLKDQNAETPIFIFFMDYLDADKANRLGQEIMHLLNAKHKLKTVN